MKPEEKQEILDTVNRINVIGKKLTKLDEQINALKKKRNFCLKKYLVWNHLKEIKCSLFLF